MSTIIPLFSMNVPSPYVIAAQYRTERPLNTFQYQGFFSFFIFHIVLTAEKSKNLLSSDEEGNSSLSLSLPPFPPIPPVARILVSEY
jgi:hypothetical protein